MFAIKAAIFAIALGASTSLAQDTTTPQEITLSGGQVTTITTDGIPFTISAYADEMMAYDVEEIFFTTYTDAAGDNHFTAIPLMVTIPTTTPIPFESAAAQA